MVSGWDLNRFTESLIQKSTKTVDEQEKQVVCDFVNQLCGADVGDVSVAEDQCECLIGAITVCIDLQHASSFYVFYIYYITLIV